MSSDEADIYLNIGTLFITLVQLGIIYTLLMSCLHLNRIAIPFVLNLSFISVILFISSSYLVRILLWKYQIYLPGLKRLTWYPNSKKKPHL